MVYVVCAQEKDGICGVRTGMCVCVHSHGFMCLCVILSCSLLTISPSVHTDKSFLLLY